MIELIGKVPKEKFGVACSGGVDSMAIVDFLLNAKHIPEILYFNHNTKHSHEAEKFVINFCKNNNLNLHIEKTNLNPKSNKEKIWSDLRYDFFSKFNYPVITCHHLDDCVETYIFSSIRGFQSVIPYRKNNVIRPFLLNEKNKLENWAKRRKVDFIQDESNFTLDFSRNRIRHNIIPELLKVNPGLKKVVKKFLKKEIEKYEKDKRLINNNRIECC